MGSGKTTVGERLASQLGLPFVDSDASGRGPDRSHGARDLRDRRRGGVPVRERAVLEAALDAPAPTVIAAAGGVVLRGAGPRPARNLVDRGGHVVWLRADPAELVGRACAERRPSTAARRRSRGHPRAAAPRARGRSTARSPTSSVEDQRGGRSLDVDQVVSIVRSRLLDRSDHEPAAVITRPGRPRRPLLRRARRPRRASSALAGARAARRRAGRGRHPGRDRASRSIPASSTGSSSSATARTPSRSPRSSSCAAASVAVGPHPRRRRRGRRRGHGHRRRRLRRRASTTAACPSCTCRRRCSARSTRRSAARPASTCPRARTWSAPSGSRAASSATPSCWPRCRRASCAAATARWPSTTSSTGGDLDRGAAARRARRPRASRIKADGGGRRRARGAVAGPVLNYGHTLGPRARDRGRLRPAPRRGRGDRAGLRGRAGPRARSHRRRPGRRAPPRRRRLRPARRRCRPAATPTS